MPPTRRRKGSVISVSAIRPKAAPSRPLRAALERLFLAAWRALPKARRPRPAGARPLVVDVAFADDAAIARLNRRHLRRSGPTDVLAFPMREYDPERRAFLLGQIAVGYQTAAREAEARGLSREEELARYALHGFLHLLGYRDATAAQRKAMESVQESVLEKHHPRAAAGSRSRMKRRTGSLG